jgi:hypothetical protein
MPNSDAVAAQILRKSRRLNDEMTEGSGPWEPKLLDRQDAAAMKPPLARESCHAKSQTLQLALCKKSHAMG